MCMGGVFSGRHSMSPLGEMRGAACRYAACHMSCTLSHAWRACRGCESRASQRTALGITPLMFTKQVLENSQKVMYGLAKELLHKLILELCCCFRHGQAYAGLSHTMGLLLGARAWHSLHSAHTTPGNARTHIGVAALPSPSK